MPMSDHIRRLRERIGNDVLEIPTVCMIVFDERDRVLLVRHVEGNQWTTPGGMVEPYELPADAAVREAFEETGLVTEPQRIAGVFGGIPCSGVYSNGDRISFVSTVFVGKVTGGTLRPDGVETLETRYFARSELKDIPLRPHVMLYLDAAWAGEASAGFQPPTWVPPPAG